MRSIVSVLFCFLMSLSYGQSVNQNYQQNIIKGLTDKTVNFDTSVDKKKLFLFENTDVSGIIFSEGKSFEVQKVNFEVVDHNFLVNRDANNYLVLKSNDIDSVRIKDILFYKDIHSKNLFVHDLFSNPRLKLKKTYGFKYIKGKLDNLTGVRSEDEFILSPIYILEKNGTSNKIELKKSQIKNLYGKRFNEVNSFVKKNKLSFRDEDAITKIMTKFPI